MPFIADSPTTKIGFTPDKKTVGGFIGNAVDSTGKLLGDTASAIIHPIKTVKSIYGLGSGIVQLVIPGEQGNEKLAKAVGQFYANRYGSLDKAWNSLYSDPAGVAADVSTVLGIGAGAFKLAGAGKAAEGLSVASKIADPLNVASKIPGVVKGRFNVLPKVGSELENFGTNFATRGLGTPKQLAKVEGVAGMKPAALFDKYGTWDRSSESFNEAAKIAGQQVKTGVRSAVEAGVAPDMRKILQNFDNEIAGLSKEAQTSDKAALAASELARRKQMVITALNTNPDVPILEKIRQIKSSFQRDIPQSTFGMPSQDVGRAEGTTRAYRALISGIEDAAPGTKQAGREQSALIKLQDIAKGAEQRGNARMPLNFTRLAGAGIGGMLKGVPGAIGGFVAEQVANSPQAVKAVSQGSIALGKKLENMPKLPPVVGNVFTKGYDAARASRVLSPSMPSLSSGVPLIPTSNQNNQSDTAQQKAQLPQTYTPIISKDKKPLKSPSNVFKNKTSFGKVPRIKVGSFK
jgi:hypothetical protein